MMLAEPHNSTGRILVFYLPNCGYLLAKDLYTTGHTQIHWPNPDTLLAKPWIKMTKFRVTTCLHSRLVGVQTLVYSWSNSSMLLARPRFTTSQTLVFPLAKPRHSETESCPHPSAALSSSPRLQSFSVGMVSWEPTVVIFGSQ